MVRVLEACMMKIGAIKFLLIFVMSLSTNSYAIICHKEIESNINFKHCVNNFKNYPRPIHFFIPTNIDFEKVVYLNLHFHGFNLEGHDHFNKKYADYGAYLVSSGLNGVMIIPESIGKCETYNSFFESQDRTQKFFNELNTSFDEALEKKFIFSGHSGAYKVLNKLFSNTKLEEVVGSPISGVGLFDATYASVEGLTLFVEKQSDRIFFDAFVDGEKGTTDEISRVLEKKYSNNKQFIFNPIVSSSESVLDQHFYVLKRGGLGEFLGFFR
jgi:hypothetical protein